ncbi:MAG: hypothetical protein EOO11_17225 [Chitinophagaceae bacterium]|nr:MAG: hypothetical protein EOO11_17225 [Chitinophagaceae bacterium]
MKKPILPIAALLSVFILAACNLFGSRQAAPALEGGWRIDSVSLLDTNDGKAALVAFLFAAPGKDSLPTFVEFGKDSVTVYDAGTAQQYAYSYKAPKLVVTDSTAQELTVQALNDSALVLNSGDKLMLYLRRTSADAAQDASRPR